jgi:hypothetical protein
LLTNGRPLRQSLINGETTAAPFNAEIERNPETSIGNWLGLQTIYDGPQRWPSKVSHDTLVQLFHPSWSGCNPPDMRMRKNENYLMSTFYRNWSLQ